MGTGAGVKCTGYNGQKKTCNPGDEECPASCDGLEEAKCDRNLRCAFSEGACKKNVKCSHFPSRSNLCAEQDHCFIEDNGQCMALTACGHFKVQAACEAAFPTGKGCAWDAG